MARNLSKSPFSEFSLVKAKTARRKKSKQFLDGHSRAIQEVCTLIENVSPTDANVLILGESGTGKELVARGIHSSSKRDGKPFVEVNCAAIPPEFLESELFGHEKGAFPEATTTQKGKLELAEGGTIFLDEIGDMNLHMQAKLLRVLEDCCFQRVGASHLIYSNVRIIAATHLKLDEMVSRGEFRDDLYYRLNVFPIELPPLRRRTEDIPALIFAITEKLKEESNAAFSLTSDALKTLSNYHWPGNVRELSNLMQRLSILYPEGKIDSSKLPHDILAIHQKQPEPEKYSRASVSNNSFVDNRQSTFQDNPVIDTSDSFINETESVDISIPNLPVSGLNLKAQLAEIEIHYICEALERSDGVVARAAELLGLRRTTLVEKLRKYDIER